MNKLNVLLTLVLAMTLAGCAAQSTSNTSSDNYQLGDGFDALMARQAEYCATASPARRAVLLAVIRSQVPMYPVSGLCSDAEQALAEELARQAADLPPVDMEQAREDQRRFADPGPAESSDASED